MCALNLFSSVPTIIHATCEASPLRPSLIVASQRTPSSLWLII
jgi:hypothetical protein